MTQHNDKNEQRSKRDIELFNEIAGDYSKKDLFLPSRNARHLRLSQTLDAISYSKGDIDILEIGCGAGFSAQYLKGRYKSYTGIDYSEELINVAKKNHSSENIEFVTADLFDYAPNKKFDVIILIGVLHHIPNILDAMKQCYKLLIPGGFIVANEPQPSNFFIHFLRKLRAKIDITYSEDQEELERDSLIKLFDASGLINTGYKPQGVFSTPFAEVIIKPKILSCCLSSLCCWLDTIVEKYCPGSIKNITWNVIVFGQKNKS